MKRTHKAHYETFLPRTCGCCAPQLGISQETLAHECGMNRTYLSAVERAERNISIDNIARIAGGLRVEPWRLLKDHD